MKKGNRIHQAEIEFFRRKYFTFELGDFLFRAINEKVEYFKKFVVKIFDIGNFMSGKVCQSEGKNKWKKILCYFSTQNS